MPTTNAVPSDDPSDLLFNAQKLDELVNGTAESFIDRRGVQRLTLTGALRLIGFEVPVAFASGLTITRSTQTVTNGGNTYHADPASLPFTTTSTFNGAQWRLASNVTTFDLVAYAVPLVGGAGTIEMAKLTTAVQNLINGALQRSGGTMTAPLTLSGNVSGALQAVPLQQVQSLIGGSNRVINGTFSVNQRSFAGGALTVGVYGYDRWKAGPGGATYTVSGETATITAGTLQQVIEGVNVPEGGTYTLSWTGTAQARVDGGAYAASPITVTGKTAGANTTVEFGTGTVSLVQYEAGSKATPFERRQYGAELVLCQRYFEVSAHTSYYSGSVQSGGAYYATASFKVTKRIASPTVAATGGGAMGFDSSNPTVSSSSADGFTVVKGSNASNAGGFYTFTWTASAEL